MQRDIVHDTAVLFKLFPLFAACHDMKQESIEFSELPADPAAKAEQDTVWWLVNRIRTRADAEEVFRVASRCVAAVYDTRDLNPKILRLRAAIGVVGDALGTWDDETPTDADKLQAWESLDAQLARRARESVRSDRAACFHYGRLLFTALREAYGIQKQSNATLARWQTRREVQR